MLSKYLLTVDSKIIVLLQYEISRVQLIIIVFGKLVSNLIITLELAI